ncbi:MAG: hypothetical protein GTO41_10510 [Burkholderiales bacterium]|nr:hypothetical protein [Burkholderiales bacterium]
MKAININQLQERLSEFARIAPDASVYVQIDTLPAGMLFSVELEQHPDEAPTLFLLATKLPPANTDEQTC